MRTLLICHEGDRLDQKGLARWLASFSDLVGLIILRETGPQVRRRIRRELQRVGMLRFCDVLAFRMYHKLFLSKKDHIWEETMLSELCRRFPEIRGDTAVLYTHSPNTPEAEQFIKRLSPDLMLARCKTLLKEAIFSLPLKGTFVMHPGICPEYRNSHGCFWALAQGDLDKVGMTLLQIDKGIDTGPIYGYYSYPYDALRESHSVIQYRVVFENLDALQKKLIEIYKGDAVPLQVSGRSSATWGQPWLTSYLRWTYRAWVQNHKMKAISLLYHDVVDEAQHDLSGFPGLAAARYKLDVVEFERHLKAIAQAVKGKPASVFDLLKGREKKQAPFLLTFDDGGASAYSYIADILADFGWSAHFFITVDCIGSQSFLTSEQVRELRRMGHVIGTHSCSHPERMAYCTWQELVHEWSRSVEILSDILGERVLVGSVPGGYYSKKVAGAASSVGIKALFTSEPIAKCHYVDGCLVLGRYTIMKGMAPETAGELAAGQLTPRLKKFLFWNLKKIAKSLGGNWYLKARNLVLEEYTSRR